jgi:cysteine desulfurase/selenocysteine lyase
MEPSALRADMPALERTTYMNTGASGPSPTRVVEAVESCLERHEYEAPAKEGSYPFAFDVLDRTRETVANHLGATEETLALTQSTTDGINRIAAAIDWESGDRVVRTDLEHSSGILPWKRLDAGALVLVDAVQCPGQMATDVTEWGADFVAGAGHKWLLGPFGAGFCYVRDGAERHLNPAHIGYRSVEDPNAEVYAYEPGAQRLEVGTVSPATYAGLGEAIGVIEDVGYDTIENRIRELTDRLKEGLVASDDARLLSPREYESGLVTFEVDDSDGFVERLVHEGIRIRSLPYPENTVRASVHVFNTKDDIDALLEYV